MRPYRGKVMEQLGRLVDYAKANEVILLHENEKDIYGDVADRCSEIMQKEFYGDHLRLYSTLPILYSASRTLWKPMRC